MKKIIFILIVTLNLQFTFSQSNFSQGFSDGYKKGYCQNQSSSCISPLPPISPIPGVNENINSYQDGYNRGFTNGLNSQKYSNSNTERTRYQTSDAKFVENKMYSNDYNDAVTVAKTLYNIKDQIFKMGNENPVKQLELCEKGLTINPNDAELLMLTGNIYARHFYQDDKAIYYLEKAYRIEKIDGLYNFIQSVKNGTVNRVKNDNQYKIENNVEKYDFIQKIYKPINSIELKNNLNGTKYAYFYIDKENIKDFKENPNRYPLLSNLIKYLRDVGFEDAKYGSDNYNNLPSLCDVVNIFPSWDFENNTFKNITLSFMFCNGESFKFTTSNDVKTKNNNYLEELYKAFQGIYKKEDRQYLLENKKSLQSEFSDWKEVELKNYLSKKVKITIEGIYESTVQNEKMPKYKVGVVKYNETYNIVYLSGAINYLDWIEGEIKAKLIPTGTSLTYKADWKMGNKSINNNTYISFEKGYMNLTMDGVKTTYIKMFPASN